MAAQRPLEPSAPPVRDRLRHAIRSVPTATRFPTVDALRADLAALAEAYPDRCAYRRIGTSRLGEPIEALRIGSAPENALVIGGVHANEPIGSVTASHLAHTLLEEPGFLEETELTWHIVGCIDPDAMRLNEGWFAGPFDRAWYGRNFYRPAPQEQVEWTFPFQYKDAYFDAMLPETVALMRLIDDTRPAFLTTLHNGEFGGVYYYLSEETPELVDDLHAIPSELGIPLELGEPEVPFTEEYAAAIFSMIRAEDDYDFHAAAGVDVQRTTGSSSAAYAEKYGTLTLVTEVPYWTNPASYDTGPGGLSYATVLDRQAAGLQELATVLQTTFSAVESELSVPSAYLRASRAFLPVMQQAADAAAARARDSDPRREATVAEAFGCADQVHCFRLRYGGMLLRALDAELASGTATPRVRIERGRLAEAYERWCTEATDAAGDDTTTLEIGSLAAIQYAAILAGAECAVQRRRSGVESHG